MLHGLLLIGQRAFRGFCELRPRLDGTLQTPVGTAARISLTFLSVALAWVFFRAATFADAATVLQGLFVLRDGLPAPLNPVGLWGTWAVVLIACLLTIHGAWERWAVRLPAPLKGLAYATVLVLALVLAPGEHRAFIYFQF